MPRKRTHAEVEASEPVQEYKAPSLLQRIRNMWEFACVMQFIFMFGKALKIDEDFDIEDFENECLQHTHREKLEEIGLTLLKFISSHRGLNKDIWDEYTRRQYLAKAPGKPHPYGDEEEPLNFRNFDVFTQVRVLHQLTVWTFFNPDKMRGILPEQKESEQMDWRMNIFGWDEDDREYFVLDDSRLYRRTEPPLPPPPKAKPKATSLKAQAARRRASKRRKLEESEEDTENHEADDSQLDTSSQNGNGTVHDDDTFGGYKWECVAISLDDYESFIASLRTKPVKEYPNERAMRDRLNDEVLPVIQELAERQRRKQERRERELMLLEKMAGAKRSSRLAGKQERERKEQEEAEAARKLAADLAEAHREQERQEQMEQDRQSRMMTREQRIKDREFKRLLMEEELARDAEEQKRIEEGEKRGSERHIRDRIEKNKRELEDLENEEDWTFDCSGCGVHGKNIDDGSHSIACERCSVWQHSKCLGISKSAAEKDDFTFVCRDCRRKEEESNRPKITLKFRSGQSSSPPQPRLEVYGGAQSAFGGVDVPPKLTFAHSGETQYTNGGASRDISSSAPDSHDTIVYRHVNGMAERPIQNPGPHASQYVWQNGQPASNGLTYETPNLSSIRSTHTESSSFSLPGHTRVPSQAVQRETPSLPPSQSSIASTPRPLSAHSQHHRPSPRLPSPVLNPPTMSPTQGNPDVGPIAGIPNSSPSGYHAALFTPQTNGFVNHVPQANGNMHQSSSQLGSSSSSPPSRLSQTPQPQHMSGLSPVKQRTSPSFLPPPPSGAFDKQIGASTPGAVAAATTAAAASSSRSISGTPIFPPAENLAPSPQQLHRDPVPTPSKQPLMPGEAMDGVEMGHVNGH